MSVSLRRLPLPVIAWIAVASVARAHVLDEYLQATLVAIEPDGMRLHMNLTPGVEVADQILAEIDRDSDGAISSDEAAAYAQRLKSDLAVRLDERELELEFIASRIPEPAQLRTGHGIIQIVFALSPGSLTDGPHRLKFEDRHFRSLGAYLFNAARPESDLVRITRQSRNANQSVGEIEFTYTSLPRAGKAAGILSSLALLVTVAGAAIWRMRRNWLGLMRLA